MIWQLFKEYVKDQVEEIDWDELFSAMATSGLVVSIVLLLAGGIALCTKGYYTTGGSLIAFLIFAFVTLALYKDW